jgi:hypothetical protein
VNKLLKENWNAEDFGEEFAGGNTELFGRVFEIEENDDDELADQ